MTPLTKPLTRRISTRRVAHGVATEFVVTLHPNGTLEIREFRHRNGAEVWEIGVLYLARKLVNNGL